MPKDGKPLPTTLGGTTLTLRGAAAPVYYVSDRFVSVQAPALTAGSTTRIQVTSSSGASASVSVPVVPVKPGLITYEAAGKGQAKAINQDGSLNGDGSTNSSRENSRAGNHYFAVCDRTGRCKSLDRARYSGSRGFDGQHPGVGGDRRPGSTGDLRGRCANFGRHLSSERDGTSRATNGLSSSSPVAGRKFKSGRRYSTNQVVILRDACVEAAHSGRSRDFTKDFLQNRPLSSKTSLSYRCRFRINAQVCSTPITFKPVGAGRIRPAHAHSVPVGTDSYMHVRG